MNTDEHRREFLAEVIICVHLCLSLFVLGGPNNRRKNSDEPAFVAVCRDYGSQTRINTDKSLLT